MFNSNLIFLSLKGLNVLAMQASLTSVIIIVVLGHLILTLKYQSITHHRLVSSSFVWFNFLFLVLYVSWYFLFLMSLLLIQIGSAMLLSLVHSQENLVIYELFIRLVYTLDNLLSFVHYQEQELAQTYSLKALNIINSINSAVSPTACFLGSFAFNYTHFINLHQLNDCSTNDLLINQLFPKEVFNSFTVYNLKTCHDAGCISYCYTNHFQCFLGPFSPVSNYLFNINYSDADTPIVFSVLENKVYFNFTFGLLAFVLLGVLTVKYPNKVLHGIYLLVLVFIFTPVVMASDDDDSHRSFFSRFYDGIKDFRLDSFQVKLELPFGSLGGDFTKKPDPLPSIILQPEPEPETLIMRRKMTECEVSNPRDLKQYKRCMDTAQAFMKSLITNSVDGKFKAQYATILESRLNKSTNNGVPSKPLDIKVPSVFEHSLSCDSLIVMLLSVGIVTLVVLILTRYLYKRGFFSWLNSFLLVIKKTVVIFVARCALKVYQMLCA